MTRSLQEAIAMFEVEEKVEAPEQEALDSRVLSSVIISSKLNQEDPTQGKDPHDRLLELMHSAPISALLEAARFLAQKESLAPEESLRQIVTCFRSVDQLWTQVLLQEGVARLSSQYH